MAEKKKQENEAKRAEQERKAMTDKIAEMKPPRPFDPDRLASLSAPKPKHKDPNTKPEPKPRRVSAHTRRQL